MSLAITESHTHPTGSVLQPINESRSPLGFCNYCFSKLLLTIKGTGEEIHLSAQRQASRGGHGTGGEEPLAGNKGKMAQQELRIKPTLNAAHV